MNEIEIPLTQMFIECVQEWDETDDMEWVGSGWEYLGNENFDFQKYYYFYETIDADKHYNQIKSIWKLKSEYHNDLLKVPENKIFFNVLSEQERNRLKYNKAITNAQPNLTADIFSFKEKEDSKIYINPNYTKDTNDKLLRQKELLNKIMTTANYLANLEMEDFIILTPKQANNPEIVKEAKRILNIKE